MEIPEQKTNPALTGPKSSIIVFSLLLVLVVGLAGFVYFKSQDVDIRSINVKDLVKRGFTSYRQEAYSQKLSEIAYDPKEWLSINTYKGQIIKATKEGLSGLDKSGAELWKIPAGAINPMIKTAGQYMLLADMGNKDFYIIEGKEIKWNKKTDGNIINIDISEGGHVSVIKEAKGYKGVVTVYNLQGNEFFSRSVAERYPVSSRVSPFGKQVTIYSMDVSGIRVNSALEFTDMLGKPLSGKYSKDDNIFPSIWYLNDSYIAAVGDSGIVCLDKNGNEKWNRDFDGMKVCSSGIVPGKYIVAAVSDNNQSPVFSGGSSEVRILNMSGQQNGTFQTEGEVRNLAVQNDTIAVNTGREVNFVNMKGKQVGKYIPRTEALKVFFLDRQEAAVLTRNSVDIVKVF